MRSIFLWRVMVVFIFAVLIATLISMGGYMYLSRDAFTEMKLAELTPKAETMGQALEEYIGGNLTRAGYERLSGSILAEEEGAVCIIAGEGGEIRRRLAGKSAGEVPLAEARAVMAKELALLGEEDLLAHSDARMPDGSPAIAACIRVTDAEGGTLAYVLLLQSIARIHMTTGGLNGLLGLVILVVFPLVMILSSVAMRRVADPLHRMGEVAIRMSKGDFEVRADESESGEVGLLARALNTLCDNLSETIHQLRSEKNQLDQILASFTEGIAATDHEGRITHYNPALMGMFGSVSAKTRMELLPDGTVWQAFDEVFEERKPRSMHYPMPGERMLWITISPILSEEGECTGVVGLFKDMTEMERLERTRREYVANVSHELRTPLTAVRGLLEPLADGMVQNEEDRQRYYKIMLREVLRLSRLITDMMELSRLQSGTGYVELAKTDINDLLEDVALGYGREAAQHGIRLRLEAPPMPPVMTDPDRVEQVLIILLDNAMRYTPEGGTITLKAEDGPRVNISVLDTGQGIPEADQAHVFERFYKVDKSRKEGGTGLGLSIAKSVMDKLGERIAVESTPGQGACFRFTLKKHVSDAIPLGPFREGREEAAPIELRPEEIERMNAPAGRRQDAPYEVLAGKKRPKPVEQPMLRPPRQLAAGKPRSPAPGKAKTRDKPKEKPKEKQKDRPKEKGRPTR